MKPVQCARSFSTGKPSSSLFPRFPASKLPTASPFSSLRTNFRQGLQTPLRAQTQTPRLFFTSSKQALRYYPPPTPPRKGWFDFLDNIPRNTIIYGILAANGVVFVMWYMSKQKATVDRDVSAYKWMFKNFVSSWTNVLEGRWWTPLTCTFSHKDFGHILFNGFTFFFTAPVVLQMLGNKKFLALYLGGGIISSAISLMYAAAVYGVDRPSLGASGSIYSMITLLACAAPTMTFQLYGIIPVPAWLLVSGFIGYDIYQTLNDRGGTVDTVGHLGGALSGALFWLVLRRRLPRY
ncbi:hypothetical protein BKA70DRAFT_1093896 [Coprinopsis sp. MPI-PUGE-AT-0042]|nr:hypothetical protein BKA70DRAFT_1093896 [Coprinopsis sp. MPI-PUGE-AT-0042]